MVCTAQWKWWGQGFAIPSNGKKNVFWLTPKKILSFKSENLFFANPPKTAQSALSFSKLVFKHIATFLPTKSHFQNMQGTLLTIYFLPQNFPIPPPPWLTNVGPGPPFADATATGIHWQCPFSKLGAHFWLLYDGKARVSFWTSDHEVINNFMLSPGGTQIWVGQGCAARASKPIPIFKGDFGQKGYPFLRIFLQK